MIDTDDRTMQMIGERATGDTFSAIGRRHGMSDEGVRKLVLREGTKLVNQTELDCLVAQKLEAMGRDDEAGWPTFLLPHQDQRDHQTVLSLVQWLVDRLRRGRDLAVSVHSRPTPNGLCLQIRTEDL